ncbi:MAG: 5-bromo-4-chloroindolyl phosphate hydrolysis family protein [Pseudomonadota bacterium]
MAERYGGRYSPGGDPGGDPGADPGRAPPAAGRRGYLLAAVALAFAWSALTGPPGLLAYDLAAAGVLLVAAWLTREGERAAAAYAARTVARRPAFPRKLFASALTVAGLFLGGIGIAGGLPATIALALAGGILHLIAFGPDPLRDKGSEGTDAFERDRVTRVVDEAETRLDEMRAAVARVADPALIGRVKRFSDAARRMCRMVEEDPRDLAAARRYLVVYVTGARDAARKFSDLWSRSHDPALRTEFETFLDELEASFAARTQTLLEDGRTDLDIEIGVLRDRLRREGLGGS